MKTLALTVLFTLAINLFSAYANDGAGLFKANCAACHSIGKGKLVGPDLKGVHEKYEQGWLVKWIQSSQTLIKSGDAQAVEVTEKMPGMIMPDFALSNEEVNAIIGFISEKSEDKKVAAVAPVKVAENTGGASFTEKAPKGKSSLNIFSSASNVIIASVLVLMVLVIIVLASLIKRLAAELK
jgi:mono/diheme cytochrome c family protein